MTSMTVCIESCGTADVSSSITNHFTSYDHYVSNFECIQKIDQSQKSQLFLMKGQWFQVFHNCHNFDIKIAAIVR